MQIKRLTHQHINMALGVINSYADQKEFYSFGLNWTQKKIEDSLKNVAWGIFENETLISFIFLRTINDQLMELDLMVTHKDYVGKSYMNKLFLAVQEGLAGVEIWLEVHKNNLRAQNFYHQIGFIQVGERPNYYPDGGDAILMTLKAQ